MKNKKIVSWIGMAVTVVAFLFIIQKLRGYAVDLSTLLEPKTIGSILLLSLVYGGSVLINAVVYQGLYRSLCGDAIPPKRIVKVYVQSNLYRYIPGNVLHYVGRNQLAVEYGVPHLSVAGVTLLEIIILTLASVCNAALFAHQLLFQMLRQVPLWVWIAAAVVLIFGGIFLFRKRIFHKAVRTYFSAMNGRSLRVAGVALAVRFALFVVYGWLFDSVLHMAGAPSGAIPFFTVTGMYAICWFIGFIVPGAPGGLGVREALLLYFFGQFFGSDLVLTAAVMMRLITVMGDVLAFLISRLIIRGNIQTTQKTDGAD